MISSIIVSFMKRDGCWTGLGSRLKIVNRVYQSFVQCEIECKSVFRILAVSLGRSTVMYRLASSAKKSERATDTFHNVSNVKKKKKRAKYRSLWDTS